MFDDITTVSMRTVNGKRDVSDEQTLVELEFTEACEELVEAEREFAEWDSKVSPRWAHPDSDPGNLRKWFDASEQRRRPWPMLESRSQAGQRRKMTSEGEGRQV
jgi:hypothetical protein